VAHFSPHGAVGEFCLNSVEQLPLKDRRVLALVGLAAIDDLANVKAVFQKMRQWSGNSATARVPRCK
jgi:hypothetical protein